MCLSAKPYHIIATALQLCLMAVKHFTPQQANCFPETYLKDAHSNWKDMCMSIKVEDASVVPSSFPLLINEINTAYIQQAK